LAKEEKSISDLDRQAGVSQEQKHEEMRVKPGLIQPINLFEHEKIFLS
jgi:hypothetical protein